MAKSRFLSHSQQAAKVSDYPLADKATQEDPVIDETRGLTVVCRTAGVDVLNHL